MLHGSCSDLTPAWELQCQPTAQWWAGTEGVCYNILPILLPSICEDLACIKVLLNFTWFSAVTYCAAGEEHTKEQAEINTHEALLCRGNHCEIRSKGCAPSPAEGRSSGAVAPAQHMVEAEGCLTSFALFHHSQRLRAVVVSLDTLGSFPDFTMDGNKHLSLSKMLTLGTKSSILYCCCWLPDYINCFVSV